jgi:hypothetical protein
MIEIKKPTNLDGQAVIDYLATNGVTVTGYPYLDGEGKLFVEVKKADESKTLTLMESFE